MKKMILLIALLLVGCKSVKYVPVESETIVIKKDSIIEKIDTQYIEIPKEYHETIVLPTETLCIETNYAVAYSWLDTTFNALRGKIENKDIKVPVEVKEVEKICYRDSLVTKEVPVEVEVVKYKRDKLFWFLLGFSVLVILYWLLKNKIIQKLYKLW